MKLTVLLLLTLSYGSSYASKQWISLTAKDNKHCQKSKPCFLKSSDKSKSHRIIFELEKEAKDKIHLKKINVTLGSDKTQSFSSLSNVQRHFMSESFGLFAMDLNSDGFLDFALKASRSLQLGDFYYYWVFNPSKNEFVQTEEQLEKLVVVGKNRLKSRSEKNYRVGKDFKINLVK